VPLAAVQGVVVDLIVAVHTGPGFDEPATDHKAPLPALVRAHGEAIRVMMAAQVETLQAGVKDTRPPVVWVRPVKEREATFAVAAAGRYIEAGYQATREALGAR